MMEGMEKYLEWLEKQLNLAAERCRSYTVGAGESPPESMVQSYYALRDAWDGYQIIVAKDKRYKHVTAHRHTTYMSFLKEIEQKNPDGFRKLRTHITKDLRWW